MDKSTYVDRVAMVLPWLGGLVPATMTGQNAYLVLGYELWQAVLIAVVVEAIGFVTITTTLDLLELYQDGQVAQMQRWDAPRISQGLVWVAFGGTVTYLFVVVSVNSLLDTGEVLVKVTKALMASFGLLGGLMVALRNQMSKTLAALEQVQARNDEMETAAKARQDEIEREERAHAWQIEKEKIEFELQMEAEKQRQAHELKLIKLEEKSRKLAGTFAENAESSKKLTDGGQKLPETFGKWKDWRKVPESEKKIIASLESAEQVSELYGVPLKTGGNWLKNAKKEFPEGLVLNE
ncbi:MAG TPA: hypothetical protein DCG54_07515 [Anaerolineae bacterium]|jgi:hypothetical protein|nr:hypothetical protein [Anaerolineae bacterium]